MPELASLIERCREGDEAAWEALVRQFQGRVYSLALHYLGEREEARDAAQEIFVKVYRGLHTFEGTAFVHWLLQLSRNHCVDRLRRRRSSPPARDVDLDASPALPDLHPNPESACASAGRKRLVWRALAQLSAPNREILLLKEIQGLGFAEIASLLGIPLGTVKSRSNRARLELARRIVALEPSAGPPALEPSARRCVPS